MKIFINYLCYLSLLLSLLSCEKDGTQSRVTDLEPAELISSLEHVDLASSTPKKLALQFVWNSKPLESNAALPLSALQTTLQISTSEDFATIARSIELASASYSFTHEQLNTLALALGLTPNESHDVFVRVKNSIAVNSAAVLSNVVKVSITPYEVILAENYLYVANIDLNDFTKRLFSKEDNGIYDGFVYVAQYFNFLLTDAPNAEASMIYGGYPVDGNQYVLYSGDDRWNCWTANGGLLYMKADVSELSWSETLIKKMSLVGDFNGWSTTANVLTYDSDTKLWYTTFTTTKAEELGMKVVLNDNWDWFFGESDIQGQCELYTGSADGFAFDQAGTFTLYLDLSDPAAYKYFTVQE